MQDALLALQRYWTDRGCMVMQPFNTEVGAGTANPATTLRVLGPEPWHVGYVEPSVRPDDARYGENPNRLQTHTQFQVILKPDPGNPQELYLGSLEALGINIRANDVRFVEDNWAQPALGSWGLGWEVWLNGLEISQFTYFQQVGGITLDPVSVEITYGVERIMMALQGVAHFKDIAYAPGVSYGEVFGQAEYEMSRYYLDEADIAANKLLFDTYAEESRRLLDQQLPVPAYVYVLKCSHTFNVLDARGAISTTERAKAFAKMRSLTKEAAQLWTQRRAELEYPLGTVAVLPAAEVGTEVPVTRKPETLLVEIGTEEMPAAEVMSGAEAIRLAVSEKLATTRLGHGQIRSYSTPRRIVLIIDDVQPREPDAERTVRGPRVSAAFDAEGALTNAAQGFLRGQQAQSADLQRINVDGVEYIAITKADPGRSAIVVLSELLSQVVLELRSDKNMRWRDPKLSFTRPVRWLVTLLGEVVIPVAVSSLRGNRVTRVHRTAATPEVKISTADGYQEFLAQQGIIVDFAARRSQIVEAAMELAASVGGVIDTTAEATLLDEIANLVEQPNAILGSFAERYLDLPALILTTVMRKHQRYLPIRNKNGDLLPYFIAVANGACDREVVRKGNEAVLRARYEDAAFFWRADLKVPPAQHKSGLAKLTFEERLGSVADRADRIADGASRLASYLDLSAADIATVHRAGQLAKFDLASSMVIELSSLAGTMAREYALRAGETAEVATALFEMELPRNAGDSLPSTTPGALLALADRFDLLAGLFGIGANPTGSSDPFALRRAALGIVGILRSLPGLREITVSRGLEVAAARLAEQGVDVPAQKIVEAGEFLVRRYEQQLLDAGHDHRFVQAVLPLADRPTQADETLAELEKHADDPAFLAMIAAIQRVQRIVPEGTSTNYAPEQLREPAELALRQALLEFQQCRDAGTPDFAGFISAGTTLTEPINAFFHDVLVMAEEPELRQARLGLLATIGSLAEGVLDWRAL